MKAIVEQLTNSDIVCADATPELFSENNQVNSEGNSISLLTLLAVLVKIGSIGFGGGIATIALMEEDLVKRRRLLPLQEFVHGIGLGHMLGGFAVNVAAFIGYRLFGITGALLSAVAFVAPSFFLILLLSYLYFRFHAIPTLQGIMAGLSPVVIALILNAAWSIGNRVLHSWSGVALAATALIAGISRVNAALVLVAAGAAGFVLPFRETSQHQSEGIQKAASVNRIQLLSVAPPFTTSIATVFITFFKVGSVFFGGGFVLIPILHSLLSLISAGSRLVNFSMAWRSVTSRRGRSPLSSPLPDFT